MNKIAVDFKFEVIVDPQEWAPGIFAGSEGMVLKVLEADLEHRKLILGGSIEIVRDT